MTRYPHNSTIDWLVYGVIAGAIIAGLAFMFIFGSIPHANAAGYCAGQSVRASWYGRETCGHRPPGRGKGKCQTASGIPFDGSQWVVAHKTLPFGTKLRITYNGKSVVVPVQDRGPYIKGRTLDLSHAVAVALGTIKSESGAPVVCMQILKH